VQESFPDGASRPPFRSPARLVGTGSADTTEIAHRILQDHLRLDHKLLPDARREALHELMEILLEIRQWLAGAVLEPEDGIASVGLAERIDALHERFDGRSPVGIHGADSLPEGGLAGLPRPGLRLRRGREDAIFRPRAPTVPPAQGTQAAPF